MSQVVRKRHAEALEHPLGLRDHRLDPLAHELPKPFVSHPSELGNRCEAEAVAAVVGLAVGPRDQIDRVERVVPRNGLELPESGIPEHSQVVGIPAVRRLQQFLHRSRPGPTVQLEVGAQEVPVASRAGRILVTRAHLGECRHRLWVARALGAQELAAAGEDGTLRASVSIRQTAAKLLDLLIEAQHLSIDAQYGEATVPGEQAARTQLPVGGGVDRETLVVEIQQIDLPLARHQVIARKFDAQRGSSQQIVGRGEPAQLDLHRGPLAVAQ